MSTTVLEQQKWPEFFQNLPRTITADQIKIEVIGATIGSQTLASHRHLHGVTFEPKQSLLEIQMEGMTHVIRDPREIFIDELEGKVVAIQVIGPDALQHILTFA